MIPLRAYAGRRVSVFALTEAGLTAARALDAGGAQLTVWDSEPDRRDKAERLGLVVEDPTLRDWSDLSALVLGDPALLSEEPAPRLLDLARALEVPLLQAETVLAQGYAEADAGFIAGLGRQARPALHFAAHLLRQSGRAVTGPDPAASLRPPAPGAVILAAFETAPAMSVDGLCLVGGAAATSSVPGDWARLQGPMILDADDPHTRRLSLSLGRRDGLISARSTLSRGVYVAAGRLFDALDGRARLVLDLAAAPGLAVGPHRAIAAGYALARGMGVSFEAAREAALSYPGCPGYGAVVTRLGPLTITDWSSARDAAAAAQALAGPGVVVWLAGPSVDPAVSAMLKAVGQAPSAVVVTGDRRRARRKLAQCCPVQVERDPRAALALAVHAGLKAGADARLVYAPGGPCQEDGAQWLEAALDGLVARAKYGDAA